MTEFEFGLHQLGTTVLAGPILFRAEQAREVLSFYREFIAWAPEELAVYLNLRTAPALEWVPEDLRGTDVLLVIPCYSGDLDEGEALLRPLRDFGPPRRTWSGVNRMWSISRCSTPVCRTTGAITGSRITYPR